MKRINIPSSVDRVEYCNINYSSNISLFSFFNTELSEIKDLFGKISSALPNNSSTSGGEST